MKVVHISTFDRGGAALSCIRLHEALLKEGVDSTLVTFENAIKGALPKHVATGKPRLNLWERGVRKLTGANQFEVKEELADRLKLPQFDMFSNPEGQVDVLKISAVQEADVINLHWAARFIDYARFFGRCRKPMVWTLHDMNAFTGGCHYSMGCEKFTSECFGCPQLASSTPRDLARENFRIKESALAKVTDLKIVAPSQWLVECAGRSALFKKFDRQLIRYGLDTNVFREYDRKAVRAQFNIPHDARVLLFVSDYLDNERKGIRLFLEAARELDAVCCFVGNKGGELTKLLPNALHLGRIEDPTTMAQVFAAADVFALPSIQDNLPNTMLESLCCGTPVVAFDSGGTAEIIRNENGLIAQKKTAEALRAALTEALDREWNRAEISREAREMFEPNRQAKAYLEVYRKLTAKV